MKQVGRYYLGRAFKSSKKIFKKNCEKMVEKKGKNTFETNEKNILKNCEEMIERHF